MDVSPCMYVVGCPCVGSDVTRSSQTNDIEGNGPRTRNQGSTWY